MPLPRIFSRAPVLLALTGLAALGLAGCAADQSGLSERQAQDFPGVYSQELRWGGCDERFELDEALIDVLGEAGVDASGFSCAMVEVPFDWTDPQSPERIELAVTRVPATGDEPIGALFGNPGGPGVSGLTYAYGLTLAPGIESVREHYDLVGFDPRGIGRSTPVDCESDFDLLEVRVASCAAKHPLAGTMGTSQVARDMELLRWLLGGQPMHYLGYSYGTMLGATYSTLFPEQVARMVLDSASAADWASLIGTFDQQRAMAEQVAEMLADCPGAYAANACPSPDAHALHADFKRLNSNPWIAADGTEVNGERLYGYLVTALYERTSGRAAALETVAAALGGDQAAIDRIAEVMASGGAMVDTTGMIVRCHSFPDDPDVLAFLEHVEEVGMPVLLGGPQVNDETLKEFTSLACKALPSSGDDITEKFSGSPESTILVIGVTGDHATPYHGAVALTEQLGNATLLTLDGVGHGAAFNGRSSCIDRAVAHYLIDGKLPPHGTVCTDD